MRDASGETLEGHALGQANPARPVVLLGADVRVLALALLAGCATSHKLDVAEDVKLSENTHTEASGEREEGAWTETEYDFAGPEKATAPEGAVGPAVTTAERQPPTEGRTVPQTGPLVKVIVRQHGPITEAWRSSSDGLAGAEVKVALKAEDKAAPAAGCMLGLGFYGAIAIAGLLAIGIAYLRLRR